MKKTVSILLVAITLAFQSNAWAVLNPVTSNRADNATDLANGVQFDNVGAWTLTVAAGDNLGATTGVNAATLGAGGANAGTLTFAGATTLSGNVGAAANQLLAVNFNGGAGVTSNFNGTILGAVTTSLASATRLEINSNVTLTGALTLAAAANTVLNLNSQTVTQTGVYTQGAGSTLALKAMSSTVFGNIQSSGNAVIGASNVDVNVLGALTSGTAMTVVNGAAGGTNGVAITVTDNSAIYTFAGSNVTGDIIITPTRTNTLTALGTSTNASSVGAALEGVAGTSTGDMLVVQNQLAMLPTAASVDSALVQLDPEVNAGVTNTSFTALNEGLGATLGRLSEVRGSGGAKAGVSTGDGELAHNVWIKGFGSYSDQDRRGGVDGYKADVWGTALGFDNLVNEYTRIGLSGGYAFSDVDSKGNSNLTNIDSYQGTVYGSYEPDSPWYFNGAFSFAWNDYIGKRFIAFGGIGRQADADYSGQQYSVYGDANYVIEQGNCKITPTVSLQYVHLALDKYTETGADSLNLMVNGQDYDFLQSGLGVKVASPFAGNGGTWTPEIRAKWLYDFIGDKQQTTSTFTGGGASFSTNGASPAQSSFDLGAGLTFLSANSVEVSFNYDFEIKSDFNSHSGVLMVKYAY